MTNIKNNRVFMGTLVIPILMTFVEVVLISWINNPLTWGMVIILWLAQVLTVGILIYGYELQEVENERAFLTKQEEIEELEKRIWKLTQAKTIAKMFEYLREHPGCTLIVFVSKREYYPRIANANNQSVVSKVYDFCIDSLHGFEYHSYLVEGQIIVNEALYDSVKPNTVTFLFNNDNDIVPLPFDSFGKETAIFTCGHGSSQISFTEIVLREMPQ